MPLGRLDTIKEQPCSARHCIRLGRGRFCGHHRALYRAYGAPVAGPSKQLLVVHQRFLRKSLGPLHETDNEVYQLVSLITDIALEPRPHHFPGSRPGRTRQASYEGVVGQVQRVHGCYPQETNEELSVRLFWAFLTVQYVEMSGVIVHQDRHHFWTSVLRLLLTDAHRQKPSARYVEYLNARLNTLLSAPAADWCMRVGL